MPKIYDPFLNFSPVSIYPTGPARVDTHSIPHSYADNVRRHFGFIQDFHLYACICVA